MLDLDLPTNTILPKVDYGILTPEKDYTRDKIRYGFRTMVNGEEVSTKTAEDVFKKLLDTSEMSASTRSYIKKPGYEWSMNKFVATRGNEQWLEIEINPDENDMDNRVGSVIRLDLETGNPMIVDENKQMRSGRWTERRLLELKNAIAVVAGGEKVELPTEQLDPVVDSIGADFWKLNPAELEARLAGRSVTDFEKSDLYNPDTHLSVLAVVLVQMRRQGGDDRHNYDERPFGLIPKRHAAIIKTNFIPEPAEEIVVNAIERAKFLVGRQDNMFVESGNLALTSQLNEPQSSRSCFHIRDIQGWVLRITNDGRAISVAVLQSDRGNNKDGMTILVPKSEEAFSTDNLVNVVRYGFGGSGYSGTDENRRYTEKHYMFRMGQGLYNANISLSLKTAAAVLAIEHNKDKDLDELDFAKTNTDKIQVSFPNGETEITTWKELLNRYKTEKFVESHEDVGYYLGHKSDFERNAKDRDDVDPLILTDKVEVLPEIYDLPDDVVVQRLSL